MDRFNVYLFSSGITIYYKLERNGNALTNDDLGIEYYGHNAELEIVD